MFCEYVPKPSGWMARMDTGDAPQLQLNQKQQSHYYTTKTPSR